MLDAGLEIVFGERKRFSVVYALLWTAETHGNWTEAEGAWRVSLKRLRESGESVRAFMIVKGLVEVRGHRKTLLQIRGMKH